MITPLAALHAMTGQAARSDELLARASDIAGELGGPASNVPHLEAVARLLAGRPELAELALRAGDATARGRQPRWRPRRPRCSRRPSTPRGASTRPTAVHDRDAAPRRRRSRDTGHVARHARQAARAAGQCAEAERVARAGVALAAPTDLLGHHGDAMIDLASVLRACGTAVAVRTSGRRHSHCMSARATTPRPHTRGHC